MYRTHNNPEGKGKKLIKSNKFYAINLKKGLYKRTKAPLMALQK